MAEISVLIPIYNSEIYLQSCLESIKKQSFKDFEVLMIDDGSKDSSYKICKRFESMDDRFHVRHQINQGSGVARNNAIDWAMETNSNYIVWVDSDDVIHPMYLDHLYQIIKKHPEYDIVQCQYTSNEDEINASLKHIPEVYCQFNNVGMLTEMLGGTYGIGFTVLWNKIYCKDLYHNTRVKINEYFSGRMQDDVNILSQIYKNSRGCCVINETLYYYRIAENSIQHKKISNVNLEFLYIYRDLYLECKGTDLDSYADYLSERILFEIACKFRSPKNMYLSFEEFYKRAKNIYIMLNKQITFVCKRFDLRLLNFTAKHCFYSFRIYALLYNLKSLFS